MWLSRRLTAQSGENTAPADLGQVTIGGTEAGALLDREYRQLRTAAPEGIRWVPSQGETALMLRCGDGSQLLLGCLTGGSGQSMAPGELKLYSRGAAIWLKNDGTIRVDGDLDIHGSVTVDGDLTVTGAFHNG